MSEQDINRLIAKKLSYYMSIYDKSQQDLADYIGVTQATISNWCKGLKMPRMDKIDKICSFFNISRSDLMEESDSNMSEPDYFYDEDARNLAQFMYENPEYKVLFDTTRKVKREDIEFVKQMIDRVRGEDNETGC